MKEYSCSPKRYTLPAVYKMHRASKYVSLGANAALAIFCFWPEHATSDGLAIVERSSDAACVESFDFAWESGLAKTQNQLRLWNEARADYERQKSELLNQRILFGLGPPAHSREAREISDAAHGVKVAANGAKRLIDTFIPISEMGAAEGSIRVYGAIKNASMITRLSDSTVLEIASIVYAEFNPVAKALDNLSRTASDFQAAVNSGGQWDSLNGEVRTQAARLDQLIRQTDGNIQRHIAQIRVRENQQHRQYCSELARTSERGDLSQPERLRSPYAVDSPYGSSPYATDEMSRYLSDKKPETSHNQPAQNSAASQRGDQIRPTTRASRGAQEPARVPTYPPAITCREKYRSCAIR